MFIGKIVNSLQFHNDFVKTNKIRSEFFFQFFTLVSDME